MAEYFNDTVNTSESPSAVKLAEIIPVFEKNKYPIKEKYRTVSILHIFYKIFENILHDQILAYFAKILSKIQCCFSRSYSFQHCLVTMIQKWKKSLDSKPFFGALLTDLSNAFDSIAHEFMIAKLGGYGFDLKVLTFVFSYLRYRKQRVKINSS